MAATKLSSAPLAEVVDRLLSLVLAERGTAEARDSACLEYALNPRMLRAWRSQQYPTVTLLVADRVLSRTPYLWFDVWRECAEHETPEPSCSACLAYFHARREFTGNRLPRELRRPS